MVKRTRYASEVRQRAVQLDDHAKYSKTDRIRVKKLLHQLCEEGVLVVVKKRHKLHSATSTNEVAYGLSEKSGSEPAHER